MDQFLEFISNHSLLSGAWIVVAMLLLIAQLQHIKSGIKALVPQEVTNLMNKHSALVVDIRPIADFNKGHIAGSKNIPQSKLKDSYQELEKYKTNPIIVVCNSGITAGPASSQLKKAGFEQVHKLAGGIQSWLGENLPVAKS
ncbi:MAG: rhodanese-like domain-containing protein [Kangiellaceae bacterium]|jgi:rhodanese-related sulfurtransferase|nr:rhodanese-like domain-containing protein [Kangiellaceae bacterium]